MQRHIEIFPDEQAARQSVWPLRRAVPPKPAPESTPPGVPKAVQIPAPPRPTRHVHLVVEVGRAKGSTVEIGVPRFLIGRDQQCQLRPNSNAISRLHTAIEQREGRVFVRDLGSHNGTIFNDRVLRDEEAEAFHGDRLQIEALQFTFAIETRSDSPQSPTILEELREQFGEPSTDSSADTTIMSLLPDFAAPPPPPPRPRRLARPRHFGSRRGGGST